MDSTLINIECVDEIADAVGKKAEVAAITEAAMRGEIADYKESLRRRVALLEGRAASATCSASTTSGCASTRAPRRWSRACKAAGLKTLLVSGGFTFFTDRVRDRLGIDFTRSNVLEIDGRRSSPAAWSTSPGATSATAPRSARCCSRPAPQLGIAPAQAIAMGDGANDLPMMGAAGLSVAYHAKPKVREQAMVAINDGGLDRLLEVAQPARGCRPRRRELGDVAHRAVDDDAGPAVPRRRRGDVAADQRATQRRRRRRRPGRGPGPGSSSAALTSELSSKHLTVATVPANAATAP